MARLALFPGECFAGEAPPAPDMTWNAFFYIYLGLCLAGNLAVQIHFRLGRGKSAPARVKVLWAFFQIASLVPLPLLDHARTVENWKARAFSGAILSDEVTTNHRMHRYRIEGGPEFTDELGEMKGFTTGDQVEKRPGEREVRRP